MLEALNNLQWTSTDGLGALIISPLGELVYQNFEVLQKVRKNSDFTTGLNIGKNDLRHEAGKLSNINMLVCTAGWLLQHMDKAICFHATNLQMLILDGTDRICNIGLANTMSAIIANPPEKSQTLLFSATQTKSVKNLHT